MGAFVEMGDPAEVQNASAASIQEDGFPEIDFSEADSKNVAGGRQTEKGASWQLSSLVVVNAALGAGILNFPAAFDEAGGIGAGMVFQVILVLFSMGSMLILGWCSDLKGDISYQEAIGTFCGKWAQRISSFCVLLYMYGTCVTFLVIAGDQSDRIFKTYHGGDFEWYMDRKFIIPVSALLFILPLCYTKRIDFLRWPSLIASASIVYIVGLSIYIYYSTDHTGVVIRKHPAVWTDVFLVIPPICFAYQCHVCLIPVYSCLEPHNIKTYSKTLVSAVLICFVSYSIVGIFGYLTYGVDVASDIFTSYDPHNAAVAVGFIGYAIKNFMTYPILVFCGRLALETLVGELINAERLPAKLRKYSRPITVTLWFGSSLVLGVFVPNISVVIDYLGTLAAIFIFIFPGLCLWNAVEMFEETLKKWQIKTGLAVAGLYMTLGALLFGMTLTQGIQADIPSKIQS